MIRQGQKTLNNIAKFRSFSQLPLYNFNVQSKKEDLSLLEKMDPKKNKDLATKLRILQYIKPYIIPFYHQDKEINKTILKSYGYMFLSKSFFYAGPISLKYAINYLASASLISQAPIFIIGYGLCYSAYVFFEGQRNKILAHISQNALREISQQTYEHLLKLDPSFHFGDSQRQTIFDITKAQKAIESNLKSVSSFFIPFISDVVLSSVFLLYHCGPFVFLSFLMTYGGYIWFTFDLTNSRRKGMGLQKKYERQADFTLSETLSNYYNVKYYSAEKFEINRYTSILENYKNQTIENQRTLAQLNSGQRFVFSIGLTANMIYGAYKVQKGLMTAGDIVLMQSLMMQVLQPLFFLGVQWREWTNSALDIQRLFKIMDTKPKIQNSPNAVDFVYNGGEIEFQNIKFGYSNDKVIIENMNVTFGKGKWISLVGESGLGKTTMFNLIFRLYDPQQGSILIDGQDIKNLKMESFRQQICVVSQNPYLFNDTVMSNLLYGSKNKKQEDVIEVCKKLNLHDLFMSLPQGYQTLVGEQGNKFSGGEKQRISIARCLLNDAQIILLDEPTSSLDSLNEDRVMKAIESLRNDKTIIMITHRLHLNSYTNEVIYLTKDGYKEQGKHSHLIQEKNTRYSKLWENFVVLDHTSNVKVEQSEDDLNQKPQKKQNGQKEDDEEKME
ncbi:hypothetical protein ABPG74_007289 [Tetrahymena malaccensis]